MSSDKEELSEDMKAELQKQKQKLNNFYRNQSKDVINYCAQ